MPRIDKYLYSEAERFEEELCELLRIPSVSADPQRREDVHRAADWVAEQLGRLGLATAVIATDGHPLVYATYSRPTRAISGFRRRSSRPVATVASMPGVPPTTRAKCSRTSRASRPGCRSRAGCR